MSSGADVRCQGSDRRSVITGGTVQYFPNSGLALNRKRAAAAGIGQIVEGGDHRCHVGSRGGDGQDIEAGDAPDLPEGFLTQDIEIGFELAGEGLGSGFAADDGFGLAVGFQGKEAVLAAIVDAEELVGDDDAITAGQRQRCLGQQQLGRTFRMGENVVLGQITETRLPDGKLDGRGEAGGHEAVQIGAAWRLPHLARDGAVAQGA